MTELTFITAPAPAAPADNGDDNLEHLYCCDENVALCGADLTNATLNHYPAPEDECVVCYTLDDNDPNSPCALCTKD